LAHIAQGETAFDHGIDDEQEIGVLVFPSLLGKTTTTPWHMNLLSVDMTQTMLVKARRMLRACQT
jgi:hypothetical protein